MDKTFLDILNTAKPIWKKYAISINQGVSERDIEKLEQELSFKFPEDFREYLRNINGFKDFESDDSWISLWSIKRIKSEYGDHHPLELVCFADYCINLCSFGFNKQDVKVYSHFQTLEGMHFIADSFSEFLKIYLENADSLVK